MLHTLIRPSARFQRELTAYRARELRRTLHAGGFAVLVALAILLPVHTAAYVLTGDIFGRTMPAQHVPVPAIQRSITIYTTDALCVPHVTHGGRVHCLPPHD